MALWHCDTASQIKGCRFISLCVLRPSDGCRNIIYCKNHSYSFIEQCRLLYRHSCFNHLKLFLCRLKQICKGVFNEITLLMHICCKYFIFIIKCAAEWCCARNRHGSGTKAWSHYISGIQIFTPSPIRFCQSPNDKQVQTCFSRIRWSEFTFVQLWPGGSARAAERKPIAAKTEIIAQACIRIVTCVGNFIEWKCNVMCLKVQFPTEDQQLALFTRPNFNEPPTSALRCTQYNTHGQSANFICHKNRALCVLLNNKS